MPITHLVVSRPPFRDGIAPAVAPLIGKPVYETKIFLKYPLPEVLKVCDGAGAAEKAASTLRGAGLDADVVPVESLASMPSPDPVTAFDFGEDALALRFKEGGLLAPWTALRLLVIGAYEVESHAPTSSGVPDEMGKRFKKSGDRMGDAIGGVVGDVIGGAISNLGDDLTGPAARRHMYVYQRADLVVWGDGTKVGGSGGPSIRRVRLDQTGLDFAGLGDRKRATGVENWRTLLAELKARAPKMTIDDGLVKTRPRPIMIDGRLLSAHLAEESDAVNKVVANRDEFYSALLAWREARRPEREEAPEAEGAPAEEGGPERPAAGEAARAPAAARPAAAELSVDAAPDRPGAAPTLAAAAPAARPAAPPVLPAASAPGAGATGGTQAAARPPSPAKDDKLQAMLRAAAVGGVQDQAKRQQARRRSEVIDHVLFLLSLPIAVLSVVIVVAGDLFLLKIGSASKTLLGQNRTPTWLFGGGVILVLSFSFYEHWGDVERPLLVKWLLPIMLVSAAAGALFLLRKRARVGQ